MAELPPGQQTLTIQQAVDLALEHHNAGRLPEAESIYQQILQADPNQHVALHLLGVIAHQVGKSGIAVDLIAKSLAVKPDYAEAQNNLGVALKDLGRHVEAVVSYKKALAIKPDYADAHFNLGVALKGLGKLDEAVESYKKAVAFKPDHVEAHNNLGNALNDLERHAEAVVSYKKALAIKPDCVEALNNLGIVLTVLGKLDEAVDSYNKALAIKPDFAKAYNNLGFALRGMDRLDEAFKCHRRAVTLDPENNSFSADLANSLMGRSFTSIDDNLWKVLLNLLDRPTVAPASIVSPVISALRCHPSFIEVLNLTSQKKRAVDLACRDATARLSAIPLLLRVMGLTPIYDLQIERMLTSLRHAMLIETMAGRCDENSLPFAAALALQCFVNEYIYPETVAETVDIKKLEKKIEMLAHEKKVVAPSDVAALGAYRPLHAYSWSQKLRGLEWDDDIAEIVERQISEPLDEQSLRSRIICLTPIKDSISHFVREQYEENPYPRWIKTGFNHTGKSIREALVGSPLQFDLGNYSSPEKPEILIAGCGTGQHAFSTASRFSNANVLAVDLSLSSLSYSMRKANELGFSNIEFAQADIMELGNIARQFDLIESVGVLHHLGDPIAGWQVLLDLLKPGGIMKIGLYSDSARHCIAEGRSLVADKGYATSPEDIRRCRQEFIAMAEDGNENITKVIGFADFFSMSGCRDLLFHVQEYRFTLLEIEAALKFLNLRFLGFEMQDKSLLKKFKASYPKKRALTSLPLWNRFENNNPDTFRSMYQFWCQKF